MFNIHQCHRLKSRYHKAMTKIKSRIDTHKQLSDVAIFLDSDRPLAVPMFVYDEQHAQLSAELKVAGETENDSVS
jgi:hypothetical protein